MAFVTNPDDGIRIFFETEGAGEPLVLLHGSTASSMMWRQLGYVDALSNQYQLILLDARGHGQSDRPYDEDAYAFDRFVSDVIAVLDALKIETAHIFGYSLGGRVALGLGTTAPERCSSLTIGGGTYRTSPGAFDRVTYEGALETLAQEGIERFLDCWNEQLGAPLPTSIRSAFLSNDVAALVPYLRQMERELSLEDYLPTMHVPTLLIVGSRDTGRLADSRFAAARLPDATLIEILDEDHASTLVRADKVLPHVCSFLASVTGHHRAPDLVTLRPS